MLADKTLTQLLDAFSSSAPTPGGGSASALAGAISASLLAMVAAMPKTSRGTPEDRAVLDALHPELISLREDMVSLIDRDADAYNQVVAAYRLPKATDAEKVARKAAIALAMRVATDVPLETARAAASLVTKSRIVAEHGNPNAKSDAGVAEQLARAAFAGAAMNVETNLDGTDAVYAEKARTELNILANILVSP